MRDKEEGRPSGQRRLVDDDEFANGEEPAPQATQPLETLREGYSWIHALETRHPGWRIHPADGFPFMLPSKALYESRVCIVGLAGVYRKGQKPFSTSPGVVPPLLRSMRFRDRGDWSFREIDADADPAELGIAHAHYDHTEADEDPNCVFPLARLLELEAEDFIGECAPTHYSFMGYVPEVGPILDTTSRQIVPRLLEQDVDAAIVCGGCALSHQSGGLIQRLIEEAGIPTVGVSVCRDITYNLQVPRAVSLRFPLGNPFGPSMDATMQSRILRDALSLIHSVQAPGVVADLPYEWVKT